jgi:hypothetical protein
MNKRFNRLIILLLLLAMVLSGCGRSMVASDDEEDEPEIENVTKDKDKKTPGASTPTPSPEDDPDSPGKVESGVPEYLTWKPVAQPNGTSFRYGYVDIRGEVVIEPTFYFAEPFYACGLALVTTENYDYGLINAKGEYVLEPEFDTIQYSEGLFITSKGDISYVFDEKGNLKFSIDGYLSRYSEGMAYLYHEGYVDTEGNLVLKLNYDSLYDFNNGVAKVVPVYDGPEFYIDRKGKDATETVSSGLKLVKDPGTGLYGYQDLNGDQVIDTKFVYAEAFINGMAIVNMSQEFYENSYAIIDTQGNVLLGPGFSGIKRMKNGVFVVGPKAEDNPYANSPYLQEYVLRALYSKDLSHSTEMIYNSIDDVDANTICVNDGKTISFLDASLKPAKGLPEIPGIGWLRLDGEYLRGSVNSHTVIADKNGNILMDHDDLTLLGDGMYSTTQTIYPIYFKELNYPILSGLSDKNVEKKINKAIVENLVTPYNQVEEWELEGIVTFNTWSSVFRVRNLLIVDQWFEEYYGGAHGSHYRNVVNISLETGEIFEKDSLFKSPEEARVRISEIITERIRADSEENYYFEDHVTPDQVSFYYLTEDSIVYYFGEYEIGPYAMGMPEFEIPYADIMDYIDTEGAFWKSFH